MRIGRIESAKHYTQSPRAHFKQEMSWRDELWHRWRITFMEPGAIARAPTRLWTTRCCRTKCQIGGTPRELYRSELPQRFLGCMARLEAPHAIISDLYGLHFPNVWKASYDTAPNQLDGPSRRRLGVLIGRQARARGFTSLSFYNNSPKMSRPYFEILSHSGLELFYHTRLPEVQ